MSFRCVRVVLCALAMFACVSQGAQAATPGLAGGYYFGVAVDEAGRAWRWGFDDVSPGYPGSCRCSPPEPVPGPGGTGQLEGIVQVSASQHALALASDGTVWAWGDNGEGQLGNGGTSGRTDTPTRVVGPGGTGHLTGIVAVAAGYFHSLALGSDGSVWAWGDGNSGQLGHGQFASLSSVPVRVVGAGGQGFLSGADAIDAGLDWSLVLVDGAVLTFGRDFSGQRTGSSANAPVPVAASPGGPGVTGIEAISAGDDFALLLQPGGTLLSWGVGFRGQLGNGRQMNDGLEGSIHHSFPAPVKSPDGTSSLTGVTAMSAGSEHALAVRTGGSVWAWGDGAADIIGGLTNTNALGLGTQTNADGPFQALPAQVLGLQGAGFLSGIEKVAAATGPAWSAAFTSGGLIYAWGSNYFGELGFKASFCPGCDVFEGGGTNVPREVCALRLRDLEPQLSCPSLLEPDQSYLITWTPVAAATEYLVTVDGNTFSTSETSYEHVEPPAECLPEGMVHQRTFSVAAVYETSCEPQGTECVVPRFSPFTRAPDPPELSCPEAVYVGGEIVLDWPDSAAAASWEIDLDGNGTSDVTTTESTTTLVATTVGPASFAVRGVNPCGTGEWSSPCPTRIRPDTSQCVSMGTWEACSSGWVEDPPGTFVAESDYIRMTPAGAPDTDFALWVSGALKLVPATGGASFRGVVWADTVYGRLDLFDNANASSGGGGGGGADDSGGGAGILPGDLFTTLATGADLVQEAFASGMRTLLSGVPCTTETPARTFVVGCLPFDGQIVIWLNLLSGCVNANATFGVPGVPENGDVYFDGTLAICPASPFGLIGSLVNGAPDPSQAVVQLTVNQGLARLAGCDAEVADGFLRRGITDTTSPYGISFASGALRCPQLGNLRTSLTNVYIGQDDMYAEAGALSLSNLDAGLFKIRRFEGTLTRRDPPSAGYKICGDGDVGLPFALLDAEAGFTLLDGAMQRACINARPLEELTALFPGLPVFTDELFGGCFTAFEPSVPGDTCSERSDFRFISRCLNGCIEPPLGEIKIGLGLGIPVSIGGLTASLDKAGLQFSSEAVRGAGRFSLWGKSVGTADACVSAFEAHACATIDLGIVSGSAALGISDDYGVAGQVTAQVDLPYIGCCGIGTDPAPFGVSAYVGPYADPERRYGFVVKFDFMGERMAGIDIRTLKPSLVGIQLLAPFTPLRGQAVLPEDVVASESFVVAPGSKQALFIAQSDSGVPVLTLVTPSETITAETPGVHAFSDEDASAIAVDDPEPGPWIVQVSGVPPEANVTITGLGEPEPASIALTEPAAGDTSVQRVAWNASVPTDDTPTTMRVLASSDPEIAAAGGGLLLHSSVLADGAGELDVPEGILAAGTWHVAVMLDDGIGHVSVAVAPGTITVVDTQGPDAPQDATVMALHDGARVTWEASSSPDVLGYEVLVQEEDAAAAPDPVGVILPAGSDLSLDVHDLTGTSPRRYQVRAFDRSLNRGPWTVAGVAAPDPALDSEPPAAPQGVGISALSATSVRVTWQAVGDAASYRVDYGPNAGLGGTQALEGMSPVEVGAPATSLDLSGFAAGQHVFVEVSAVDAMGNEGSSSGQVSILLGSPDSADGDALADDWERLYMGDLAESDGSPDTDGDGLTDAHEFALGFDPRSIDDFAWGDLDGDGDVDIGDVVRALRLTVGSDPIDGDLLRRGNVAPASFVEGSPPVMRPTGEPPRRISVADVVMMLRAVVGLVSFPEPFPDPLSEPQP